MSSFRIPPSFLLKCFFAAFLLFFPSILFAEGKLRTGKPPDSFISGNNWVANPYQREEILDPHGKYKLEWLVDWDKETILFNVTVETLGFVIFGLSKKYDFPKADLFIGGVDQVGKPYHRDYHMFSKTQMPIVDAKQDWVLHAAFQTNTHTILSFSRALETCDDEDVSLANDDTSLLLWGYGAGDCLSEYPFATRGKVPQQLKDPNLVPKVVLDTLKNPDWTYQPELSPDVKVWSIKTSIKIPQKRTTYWCNVFKISLPQKHHIIGFTHRINEETLSNVHHSLLFRCVMPMPMVGQIYENFLNHPGEECYDPMNQLGIIPFQSCVELKAGYAIGGEKRPIFFPDNIGIPIGMTGQDEYYMLQIHYDNPYGRTDLVSDNQVNLFYSSKVRPHDAGLMNIGLNVPGTPGLLLPPNGKGHRIVGQCSSGCTKKMYPPQGIKIAGLLLHSHAAGRKLTLQHFRGNTELPPVLEDNAYISNYQPQRLLRSARTILPGDQLSMRCYFDTLNRGSTTGGYGVDQEMCVSFILMYDLLYDFGNICRSELISPAYNAKYLAGTTNLTWYQEKLEYMATAPPNVKGLVVTEISNKLVDWTTTLRGELQRDQLIYPQVDVCLSNNEMMQYALNGQLPPLSLSTYPLEADAYEAPPQCALF